MKVYRALLKNKAVRNPQGDNMEIKTMPRIKEALLDQYLKEHRRDICSSCQQWVPWYHDGSKVVRGCQVGKIPRNDECDSKSKRRN